MEENVVITTANIDDYIEQWHEDKETDLEMHEYLGLSFEQFGHFVDTGKLEVTGSPVRKPCPNCNQVMIRQMLHSDEKSSREYFNCKKCNFKIIESKEMIDKPTEYISVKVRI